MLVSSAPSTQTGTPVSSSGATRMARPSMAGTCCAAGVIVTSLGGPSFAGSVTALNVLYMSR
jgi:hypothetical protein